MHRRTMLLCLFLLFGAGLLCTVAYRRAIGDSEFHAAALEGFTQSQTYVLKRDHGCYDDFYAHAYGKCIHSPQYTQYHFHAIVDATQADRDNCNLLDVGCGTGELVDLFARRGYRAFGVDQSPAMIDECKRSCKHAGARAFQVGNALDAMLFDAASFTHITCIYYTIYYFPNKAELLQNCRNWLRNNGYLILHIVDFRRSGSGSSSSGHFRHFRSPLAARRAIEENEHIPGDEDDDDDEDVGGGSGGGDDVVDAMGFRYTSRTTRSGQGGDMIWKESFVDKASGHVRQHEKEMFMVTRDEMLQLAKMAGFAVVAQIDLQPMGTGGGDAESLFVFEKSL